LGTSSPEARLNARCELKKSFTTNPTPPDSGWTECNYIFCLAQATASRAEGCSEPQPEPEPEARARGRDMERETETETVTETETETQQDTGSLGGQGPSRPCQGAQNQENGPLSDSHYFHQWFINTCCLFGLWAARGASRPCQGPQNQENGPLSDSHYFHQLLINSFCLFGLWAARSSGRPGAHVR
jgi:hypothetical protein